MKKIFLLLATVGIIFTACTQGVELDDDNNGNNTEQPGGGNEDEIPTDKIVIKPAMMEVAAEPNDYIVAVASPCSWRATTESEWITIKTNLGIEGKQELIFSVADHVGTEPRWGKIIVANSDEGLSAELVITQNIFVPSMTIEPETLTFAVDGGTQEIAISANCACVARVNANWVSLKGTPNGVSATIQNNTEATERTAEITIASKKYALSKVVKVRQEAFVPVLEVSASTTSYECDYKGGEFTIAVTANFDYDVTSSSGHVVCSKNAEGVKILVQPNVDHSYFSKRGIEVKIYSKKYNLKGKTITITQDNILGKVLTVGGGTGVVFYFDGTVAKMVSVEGTTCAWSTEEVFVGATDEDNGANNMEKIKRISGWETKYPAFKWCSDYGEGWYLPARSELGFLDDMSLINAILTNSGYTQLPYKHHMSSTEMNSDDYWECHGGDYRDQPKWSTTPVRAVLAFEN